MNPLIEAVNLSRFYGVVLGLNNVSFRIKPGITGVVGPNGAGKTTFFRLLLGQVRPSSGTIEVFGKNPWANPEVQAQIAYCPEDEAVPSGLRPLDWLVGLGMISGLSLEDAQRRSAEMLERVKLPAEHWKKRVTQLSKGMRQRVKLAQCLLHQPKLIVLDEPMNGLDPMGREDFSNVLRSLNQEGTSVLISSHNLQDLEALCSDFLLLRWGRVPRSSNELVAPGTRQQWPASTTFRCDQPAQLARYFFDQKLVVGCDIVADEELLHVRWADSNRFYQDFDRLLLECGVRIYEVRSTESRLEKAMNTTRTP
ncbi:MAG: ABC transporter ATP-binding protein [Opitutus sp.]